MSTSASWSALGFLDSERRSLQHEHAEVLAALEFPWSTGAAEGQVNRLKLIKRQGYGRASLVTLRARYLQSA